VIQHHRQPGRPNRPRASRSGVAAVEFALVMPLFITLLLGIWEIGRMVEVSQIVQNAAREGAREASTATTPLATIQTNVQSYVQGADAGITNMTGFKVTYANLTHPSVTDPTKATQMDKFTITVTLPFDNVRWTLARLVIPAGAQLQASTTWYSMADLPVQVNTTLPTQ